MGDQADLIMGGLLCEQCWELIDGDFTGFPRSCQGCEPEETESEQED